MSKLFKQSFENMNEEHSSAEVSDKLMNAEREIQEAQEITEQVERAEDTEKTLERMDAAETDEQRVEIATESLLKMVGYSKPKFGKFSLESYSKDVSNSSSIAMEGITSRLGESIKRMFTSNKALLEKLELGVANLVANGSKEEVLKDPSWSKPLVTKIQSVYTAKDVVALVAMLDKALDKGRITEFSEKIYSLAFQVTDKLESSTFIAKDARVQEIFKLTDSLDEAIVKLMENVETPVSIRAYPDFQPIDTKTAKSLSEFVKSTLLEEKSDLNDVVSKLCNDIEYENLFRLAGMLASDIRAARKFVSILNKITVKLSKLMTLKYKVAYAVVKYIEASAK